jgi:fatty acid desaturase
MPPAAAAATAPPLTWTLYGCRYDLNDFIKHHPGGSLALLTGAGTADATQLFEAYHVASPARARAVLASYTPLPEAEGGGTSAPPAATAAPPRGLPPRDPAASAFHEELMAAARAIPGGTKMPASRAALLVLFGAALAACWVAWARGYAVSLLFLPVLTWVFSSNVAHDGGHFAVSRTPLVNTLSALLSAPLLYNTSVWYLQHNISHHVHTNQVGADVDLHHMAPGVRLHGEDGWAPRHRAQVPFLLLGSAVATLVQSLVFPLRLLAGEGLGRSVAGHIGPSAHLVAATRWSLFLQWAASLSVLAYPFLAFGVSPKALLFAAAPFAGASAMFMLFTQVSHVQEEVQQGCGCSGCTRGTGCEGPGAPPAPWSHAQVATSVDYSQDSALMAFLSGGLNMQGLHHCLPSVSSAHYHGLYPTYRALAAKHGIPIKEAPSLWAAFAGYWRHVANLSHAPPAAAAAAGKAAAAAAGKVASPAAGPRARRGSLKTA